jgi:hypothetical protein
MSVIGLRRLGLIVAFLLQAAALKAALPANPEETSAPPSLAGRLLVAAPSIGDPCFEQTSSIGRSVRPQLLAFGGAWAKGWRHLRRRARVLRRPGAAGVGFVVHSVDDRRPETLVVSGHLSTTSSIDILLEIGARKGPKKSWWPLATLAGDKANSNTRSKYAWGIAQADPALVFDEDRDKLRDYTWEHRSQHF